jgi:hypothetical protein
MKNKYRFFDLYCIDITRCKWSDIFDECFPYDDEIIKPDLIQFNFPWDFGSGQTSEIMNGFLKFAQENIAPKGIVKLGIVDWDSPYYSSYGDEIDKLIDGKNDKFELIEPIANFYQKYPGYTHVSSDPSKNLYWHIQDFGIEITFRLKRQK